MAKKGEDIIDLDCKLAHSTPNAWLIDFGEKEVWVPRSIAEVDNENNPKKITLPTWFAEKQGLI